MIRCGYRDFESTSFEGGVEIRKWIGVLLIICGLTIVSYPEIEKRIHHNDQQKLVESFQQLGNTDELERLSTNYEDLIQVEEYSKSPDEENPLMDGARGILSIDKIDLEMVVFEGTSVTELTKGIGMIEPDKKFGVNNIGLAGHRAVAKGKQFNRLGELAVDDEIQVITEDGVLDFVIVDSFVVHQSDVSVLDDSAEPLITLVTCTPLGSRNPPDRLIVQAKLKK
ncbi:class D sortase [Sporosarcina siberiensis]|uniref:Class D sortase n=1 Tax=Sporosarcina siberiensis TaxID=1365606 RepID=A0ABW4SEJ0_9BACL